MKKAFTMLELIFVIVVLGILSKFGAEIFRNTYDAFILSTVQNKMQVETETAIQQISNRLQYRLKNSVIERVDAATFNALPSASGNGLVLEWIGYDIDGWRGEDNGVFSVPTWSGFIDVDINNTVQLTSPGTDLNLVSGYITNLAPTASTTTVDNTAIFFTGEQSDIQRHYGWDGTAQAVQSNTAAHRIANAAAGLIVPNAATTNFSGVDIYEQYKLSWTAYALSLEDFNADGNSSELVLYYDYQPWEGDRYTDAGVGRELLLEHVSTFKFSAIGDLIKIQLCVDNNSSVGDYSICKEKAIF